MVSRQDEFLDVDRMAADAFQAHELSEVECVSHLVKRPGTGVYHYRVTWCPGTLNLSGDLSSITATHYQALYTFKDAVSWMHGASFDYFMEKTGVAQVYDRDETVSYIEEVMNLHDEENGVGPDDPDSMWGKFFHMTGVVDKERCLSILYNDCADTPEEACDLAHRLGISDYYGSYAYTAQNRWQWRALRHWAKMVIDKESGN